MPIADDFEILADKTIRLSAALTSSSITAVTLYSYLVNEWDNIRRFVLIDGTWHMINAFGNKVENEMA